jgi:hypothetical protein
MKSLKSNACLIFLCSSIIACQDEGKIQYSPLFESRQKLSQSNICDNYPNGFSQALRPEEVILQDPIEERTTALLNRIVSTTGEVRYRNLVDSNSDLNELKELVTHYSSNLGPGIPFTDQSKSIWINLYNLATLQLIADNYDQLTGDESSPFPNIKSIQNIENLGPEVWNTKKISTSRGNLSLNEIQKDLQKTQDPRIHFAINCASMGCPPLLASAYVGAILNQQLNERTCHFINSGQQQVFDNLDPETPLLFASQIFQWYQEDFGDLYLYIARYLSNANKIIAENFLQKKVDGDNLWTIEFEEYSWELNEEKVR